MSTKTKMMDILVINPNSTEAMTEQLKPIIHGAIPENVNFDLFTGPPGSAPPSINDHETSVASAEACFPLLKQRVTEYDGFLVACYSAHPLIPMLRKITDKPVIGIMEASVYHALALLPGTGQLGDKFGIVTTGKAWEELLSQGVEALLGGRGRLAGVESTGLDADQLHRVPKEELDQRMKEATKRLVQTGEVGVVCLGCAGMVGMKELVMEASKEAGRSVRVVDGVEAGVVVLCGMVRRYLNPEPESVSLRPTASD